ncbi:MAG: hypothetical protein JJT81_01305 [Rubellimicrobium sp.]|nr:hypothetical protein [Rubellimicrobium sp.]
MTQLTEKERNALAAVAKIDDPARLRVFIVNARRERSPIVEAAAFKRLCEVQPEANPGTVEHDVWQAIHALEQLLLEERGKTVRLSRTRQKVARHGEAKTVADLTLKQEASQGFTDLVQRGHPELTFEVVALRHPMTFDADVQLAARKRLLEVGLDPDSFVNQGEKD